MISKEIQRMMRNETGKYLSILNKTDYLNNKNEVLQSFSSVQLLSHVQLFATPWTAAHQASLSITNSQKVKSESEVAQLCLTLCNPVDCSPPGSSVHGILQERILEWVAISFSRGSSQPRDQTQVSRIAGRCFNLWPTSSNSCPLGRWCHPTISSSVISFSSRLQSFPASRSFPMRQFFASDGQSIGLSASVSVLPMNIQDWFPLGLTGFISLQFKALSRVLSNTTVQKHQFL